MLGRLARPGALSVPLPLKISCGYLRHAGNVGRPDRTPSVVGGHPVQREPIADVPMRPELRTKN